MMPCWKPRKEDNMFIIIWAPVVVFTVFDNYDHPLRTKGYKFNLKEKDGSWKSSLTDGSYHFSFPINSELSINEPGKYTFQLENRMPITPLSGINSVEIVNTK